MFKRIAIFTLAAMLAAASLAGASAQYLNRKYMNGTLFANPGSSAATPYTDLPTALKGLHPGDSLFVGDGTYVGEMSVDSSGASPIGGGVITIIHSSDGSRSLNGASNGVLINGDCNLTTPYTYITGLSFTGGIHVRPGGDRCVVKYCHASGDLEVEGGKYTTIQNSVIGGSWFEMGQGPSNNKGFTANTDTFTALGAGVTGGGWYPITFGDDDHPAGFNVPAYQDSATIEFCIIYEAANSATTGELWTEFFDHVTNLKWYNNHTFGLTTTSAATWTRRLRDSTRASKFLCDTVVVTGPGSAVLYWTTHGRDSTNWRVANITVDSSSYNMQGVSGSGKAWWYESMDNWHVDYTTILAKDAPAVLVNSSTGHSVLNHDTFVSNCTNGVVQFTKGDGLPAFSDSAITFTNNIVYCLAPYTPFDPISGYGSQPQTRRSCVRYDRAAYDSSHVGKYERGVFANHNLLAYYGFVNSVGDRCDIYTDSADNSGNPYIKDFAPGSTGQLAQAAYIDSSTSKYGTPSFGAGGPDSILNNCSVLLGPASAAIGIGSSSTDAGAVASTSLPLVDWTPIVVHFTRGYLQNALITIRNRGGASFTFNPAGNGLRTSIYSAHLIDDATSQTINANSQYQFHINYDGNTVIPAGVYYCNMTNAADQTIPVSTFPDGSTCQCITITVYVDAPSGDGSGGDGTPIQKH